jgi:Co/Zn/Cd efflux system component
VAVAKLRGNNVKTSGIILFWVGIAVILVCLLVAISIGQEWWDPKFRVVLSVLFFVAIAGLLFVLIGITLFFVGWSEGRKRARNREADDSQSDYNVKIDKS